jgi:hypothetical protein
MTNMSMRVPASRKVEWGLRFAVKAAAGETGTEKPGTKKPGTKKPGTDGTFPISCDAHIL